MGVVIAAAQPREPDVAALVATHLAFSSEVTPPGHVHALAVDALTDPSVTVIAARRNSGLVGIGALRDLGGRHAEIKSMHVAAGERGQGAGRALLGRLIALAEARGFERLSLETGTMPAFEPARLLYLSAGFVPCEPFGDYTANANSICMTRTIKPLARRSESDDLLSDRKVTEMDGFTALTCADLEFETRVRLVGADDWVQPTPCSEWDVRALVNHVVGGNRRYTMLLQGADADTVNKTRTVDHLGPDPVASFLATAAALSEAFREPGALDRIGHHPLGDRTGQQLLTMRVLDLTVHAWDLARALGIDEVLGLDAVEFALTHADVIEGGRQHGTFAPPNSPLPPSASLQTRLLHLAGRRTERDQP